MKVGFIGLGRMGGGMARRLVANEHQVIGFDPDGAALKRFTDAGGHAADSVLDVANQAGIVFASLPTLAVCEAVALGEAGIVEGKAVKIYVETSTVGQDQAGLLADALRTAKGIDYIDAPVSGGPRGAEEGSLTTVVAGARPAFEAMEPLMRCMATHIVFAGERPGLGQLYKVINNYIVMSSMALTCEAVAMGVRAGAREDLLVDVINHATGRNFTSSVKFPTDILPRAKVGSLHMAMKDVRLYAQLAEEHGHVSEGARLVLEQWEAAASKGLNVVQWYESLLQQDGRA